MPWAFWFMFWRLVGVALAGLMLASAAAGLYRGDYLWAAVQSGLGAAWVFLLARGWTPPVIEHDDGGEL